MLDPKLHTFLLLVQCQSTTRCAELLHLTQPAVSQHIKALESAYGVKLFIKEGRRLALTPQGQRLAQLCRRLATLDEQIAREMRQGDALTLRFGATLSIADGLMPTVLPQLVDHFPEIQFHMVEQNTHVLLEQLENGLLDFALIEGNFDHRRYDYHPFFVSRFVGLCSPNSPYRAFRCLRDTLQAPLILRESGSGTRDIFEGECRAHNLAVTDYVSLCEIEHIPTLLGLVAAGKGITFAYEAAARSLLTQNQLQVMELEDLQLERPFHFVCLPGGPQSELLARLAWTVEQAAEACTAKIL
ncbi:LysR family transcriptional regulator [Fournierella sp.]|uniref:LysR family transcriptional regulator n=1 Tax=Allofournierella sp. TaxID=1940256 RepID=UPI0025BDF972|nr:LysR family transcriptional regulator [Fournierella sp.]